LARIRTIKPQFWRHEVLSELPEATHILAAALLNYADDDGYFNAHPGLIKGECSPIREPSVSIQDSLAHLSNAGFIRLGFGADGKRYGHILTFHDHQIINRPTSSKIKDIEIKWDVSHKPHTQITELSVPEGNKEGNKEKEGNTPHKPPKGGASPNLSRETSGKLTLAQALEKHPGLKTGSITKAQRLFTDHGWPEIQWDLLWEEFEGYWLGEGARKKKSDWPRAFYNRAMERRGWQAYRVAGKEAWEDEAARAIAKYEAEAAAEREAALAKMTPVIDGDVLKIPAFLRREKA